VGIAIYGGDSSACLGVMNHIAGTAAISLKWQPNTAYSVRQKVRSSVVPARLVNFKCIKDGASGLTEPAWNYTLGATTKDGSAIWEAVPVEPEYGIYDRSSHGSQWVGCFTEECAGPGFACLSDTSRSGTFGCYSENYVGDIYRGTSGVYGGISSQGTDYAYFPHIAMLISLQFQVRFDEDGLQAVALAPEARC
jgi:hypothetical protein